MDFAALKTDFVEVWLFISSTLLCSSTIGCLHICLAPIGQTKIAKDRSVVLVNSPQVLIYFEYLFIYCSRHFYCALFLFSFPIVQIMHLYKYCLQLFKETMLHVKNMTAFKWIVHPICILHVFLCNDQHGGNDFCFFCCFSSADLHFLLFYVVQFFPST